MTVTQNWLEQTTDALGASCGQEEQGVDPGRPLDRSDGGMRIETLLVADVHDRSDFAVDDFQFPTLPGPSE